MVVDHRTLPRRRGRELEQAILLAAHAELEEAGYANLAMERVAARARTSKASVYRRWPSRVELVADLFHNLLPDPEAPPDTGSLRGDLVATFRQTAALLSGPSGEALRGLLANVLPDFDRTVELRGRSNRAGARTVEVIARRAVERGEIAATAITPWRLRVGPALLRQQFLFDGPGGLDAAIPGIVDEVVIPLLTR